MTLIERYARLRSPQIAQQLDIGGLIGLEPAMLGPRNPCFQIAQIAYAVPPQASIQTGARDIRVQESPHHREQVIQ